MALLGNLYKAISDDDARATLDAAWEGGVRYFDTAPLYGLGSTTVYPMTRPERCLQRFLLARL
jgi:aryl-alcohol dehydrogenase-like predicted oxidoreductase